MKNLKLTLVAAAMVTSGTAVAATDGSLDPTASVGTSIVTIIKSEAVQITNVNDIDLGTHNSLAADAAGSDDVCVFSSTGSYSLEVNSANNLNLAAGPELMPYSVTWNAAAIALDTPVDMGATANSDSPTCGGGTNANFGVTVAMADFNGAAPGNYTDLLTFTVRPM